MRLAPPDAKWVLFNPSRAAEYCERGEIKTVYTKQQKAIVINKLLAICENEILDVAIPENSSFEDLPFECQLQYMCFVKCADLFSSIGENEQAVNSYLRVGNDSYGCL